MLEASLRSGGHICLNDTRPECHADKEVPGNNRTQALCIALFHPFRRWRTALPCAYYLVGSADTLVGGTDQIVGKKRGGGQLKL
jgi:hypothetical protein